MTTNNEDLQENVNQIQNSLQDLIQLDQQKDRFRILKIYSEVITQITEHQIGDQGLVNFIINLINNLLSEETPEESRVFILELLDVIEIILFNAIIAGSLEWPLYFNLIGEPITQLLTSEDPDAPAIDGITPIMTTVLNLLLKLVEIPVPRVRIMSWEFTLHFLNKTEQVRKETTGEIPETFLGQFNSKLGMKEEDESIFLIKLIHFWRRLDPDHRTVCLELLKLRFDRINDSKLIQRFRREKPSLLEFLPEDFYQKLDDSDFFSKRITYPMKTKAAKDLILGTFEAFERIESFQIVESKAYLQDLKNILEELYKYEEILYGHEAQYRDHINHQLRVILLEIYFLNEFFTAYIIGVLNKHLVRNDQDDPAFSQMMFIPLLFAHVLHDIALPIQTFDKVNTQVAKMMLQYRGTEIQPPKLSWNPAFILGMNRFLGKFPRQEHMAILQELNNYNHGVVGGFYLSQLYQILEQKLQYPLSQISFGGLESAYYSIFIEAIYSIIQHNLPTKIDFTQRLSLNNPRAFLRTVFTFLLYICDEIQEWRRRTRGGQIGERFAPLDEIFIKVNSRTFGFTFLFDFWETSKTFAHTSWHEAILISDKLGKFSKRFDGIYGQLVLNFIFIDREGEMHIISRDPHHHIVRYWCSASSAYCPRTGRFYPLYIEEQKMACPYCQEVHKKKPADEL
ncbi:MAG: hypothetical protein ACTSQI_18435 [Candidatus Helarchaeota archaeon]